MSLHSLKGRKESTFTSSCLLACSCRPCGLGVHRPSERRVLIVYGPQVAPGGGVHFVVRVPGTVGRLQLQMPQAVGQFLGRRHQVEDLLLGGGAAWETLWAQPPWTAGGAKVGKAQL